VAQRHLLDHFIQFTSLGGFSKHARLTFNIIWLSITCVIWNEGKRRIFQHKDEDIHSLGEKVKLNVFWWSKSTYDMFDLTTLIGGLILLLPCGCKLMFHCA